MIELNNVSRIYQMGSEKIFALKNIDLEINKGEFVCVVGPSGSGKTTLLNVIGGLDSPTEGQIIVDDNDINSFDDKEKSEFTNKTIGFVFQTFNLMPFYTALENTLLPLLWAGVSSKERTERAEEALTKVGLKNRMGFRPTQLSSGQRQRVSIARAIINNPKIILADEPTGNLDSKTGNNIMELLQEINKSYGATLVVITHDPKIAKTGQRVIEIKDGKLN